MPFIQENIIEIDLGLKRRYKLIQFSDVHISVYKDTDSKEVIDEAIRCEKVWDVQKYGFADSACEHYDESHKIPSKECLVNIVNYINEEKPIATIMTGDILDYYSESNYDFLLEQCGNLNYPFVFACGNHEFPVNRYIDLTCDEEGFMVLELMDFKLISLDNSTKRITKTTLSRLRKELRGNKKVFIAMHVPVCTKYNKEEMSVFDSYFLLDENDPDEINREFVSLLVNNDKIKALFCGHVHRYCESFFAPNKKQYCASSGLIGKVNKILIK